MSLFHPLNLVCPACAQALTMQAVGSVNADRRPDLRQSILDDKFQDTLCPKCGEGFRLQPQFNFLHVGKGQWIAAMPSGAMPNYLAVEDDILAVFETAYGSKAPPAAREIGNDLSVRLTFGWPALREKIQARALGLDDVTLEILKLEMLRAMPSAPMKPGVELRLIDATASDLAFLWLETASESSAGEGFVIARTAYDAIASAPAAYAELRAELSGGPFVDMQKLYMGAGRGAAVAAAPDPDAILAGAG